MNAPFLHKTRAEQRLDHLKGLRRPLTDDEADELYRALHAIYVRDWRRHLQKREGRFLQSSRAEELRLLEKVRVEAGE